MRPGGSCSTSRGSSACPSPSGGVKRDGKGEWGGRVLSIRSNDLITLGSMYEVSADELGRRLGEWGLLAGR